MAVPMALDHVMGLAVPHAPEEYRQTLLKATPGGHQGSRKRNGGAASLPWISLSIHGRARAYPMVVCQ